MNRELENLIDQSIIKIEDANKALSKAQGMINTWVEQQKTMQARIDHLEHLLTRIKEDVTHTESAKDSVLYIQELLGVPEN